MKPNRLSFALLFTAFLAAASVHAIRPERTAADGFVPPAYLSEAEIKWLEDHPVIRVAGPRAFPPFHFYEDGRTARGISADTIAHLAAHLGLTIETAADLPWPEVLARVRARRLDVVACIAKTAERETYLRFTAPYLSFPLVVMTRKDAPFIGDIRDLNDMTVAFARNVSTYDWIRRDGVPVHPLFVETPLDALRAVATGRADAHIGNLAADTYMIETHGLTNLKVAAPTPYSNYDLHFAVRGDWPELAAILDKAAARMDPGARAAIRNRWLSIRYEHGFSLWDLLKWTLAVATAASIGLAALFLWNRRLRREIRVRENAEEALRESEENYRQLVELSPDMIVVHKAGVIQFINTAGLKMMRAERRDQIVGKNVVSFVCESHKAVAIERMRSHGRRIGEATPLYEQRLVRLDGEAFDVDLVGIPFFYKGELITQLIIRDISDRKAAEGERKRLEDQLRQSQKMEAVGTLAGGIAHDFNNVLGIILSNVELALPLVGSDNPLHRRLDRIRTAGLRARDIVHQLLGFARKTKTARRPVRWSPIIEESARLMRATLPASIDIRHWVDAPSDVVLADPTQLQQVIINLCANAGHAMKDGGALDISLATVDLDAAAVKRFHGLSPGPYLELTVADTGHGIAPAIRDRIFDPYFTTKDVGEGTGMGLSVVQRIVRDCGGAVSVDSEPGRGTRFRLLFPAADAVPAEAPAAPPSAEAPSVGGERILFIDDETLITESMGEILEALGYAVEVQNDPLAALERFSAAPNRFDLIITDMNMPGMTGDRLAQAVQAIRTDIPVILCTGDSSGLGADGGPGINVCLTKPVTMKGIASAVRKALDGRTA